MISETDSITINGSGLSTANGSISLFTVSGTITQDAPVTAGSNLVAGASYNGSGVFEFVPSTLASTAFLWTKGADDTDFGDQVGAPITATGVFTAAPGATKLVLRGTVSAPVSAVVQSSFWSVILQSGGVFFRTTTLRLMAGPISVSAATGSITMDAATRASSVGGNIRYAAGTGIALAELDAGAGDVSLVAAANSITDQNMGVNLTAAGVRFETGGTFGQSDDAIETDIATLAGQAAQGVFVLEASDLTLGSVSVATQYLAYDLSMATLSDGVRSGVVTASNGPVVVELTDGSLTVDQTINANGAGNIRLAALAADRDIFLNQGVISGSGVISVLADRHIAQAAAGDVATMGATIDLFARDGSITMTNGALTSSGGAAIRYFAGMNVLLGGINSGSAATSVTAMAGSITDNGEGHADIVASSARLVAGMGIGGSAMAAQLDVALGALAASAGAGGAYLGEADDIAIDTVGPVTVERVASDGTALGGNPQTDDAMSDLVATGAGNIVLQTSDGSIIVNEGVSANMTGIATDTGNIRLVAKSAMTADKDITLNVPITSNAGSISLIANRNVVLAAAGDVSTAGSGTIELEALNGAINMTDGALIQTANQPVRLKASGEIKLGGVDAGNSLVSLIAVNGSISDNGNAHVDVAAGTLRLEANIRIGSNLNLIDAAVDILGGSSGSGGILLQNARTLSIGSAGPVTVDRVDEAGATPSPGQLTDGALDGLQTSGGSGPIVVIASDGSLSVNQPVNASLGGNILLKAATAGANDKNLVVNAAVTSGSGHISLLANFDLQLTAVGDVTTGGGTVDLWAEKGTLGMDSDSLIRSQGGVIRAAAQVDVILGKLDAGAGALSVNAITGSILGNGSASIDLAGGDLRLVAGDAVGASGEHLDTAVDKGAAQAGAGGIHLTDSDALAVGAVSAVSFSRVQSSGAALIREDASLTGLVTDSGDGNIVQQTLGGNLTVDAQVSANGSGNIRLSAGGAGMNLEIRAAVSSQTGHITLVGQMDLIQSSTGGITTSGGSIDAMAVDGSIDMDNRATAATGGGFILYEAAVNVGLGGLNAGAGNVSVIAAAGSITDNGDTYRDVIAASLRLVAGLNIGVVSSLDTAVETLAAHAVNGGVSIIEADEVVVATVAGIQVNRVAGTAADAPHPAVALPDLSGLTAGSGHIGLLTLNGHLTVDQAVLASGTGHVLLQARTSDLIGGVTPLNDKDLFLNAPVTSTMGHISVRGNRDVTQALAGNITSRGDGTLDVEARFGSITMLNDVSGVTAGGNIRYSAAMNVQLVGMDAMDGDVSILATQGSITDSGSSILRVTGAKLRLVAGAGIGTGSNHLDTAVGQIAAQAAGGGVHVINSTALAVESLAPVSVNRVQVLGSTAVVSDTFTVTGLVTTSGDGNIVLSNLSGDLTINQFIAANGDGNVLLNAANDLLVQMPVQSATGNITLNAGGSIFQAAAGDVSTGDGTIDVTAVTGSINMTDGAGSSTLNRNIRYQAQMDVQLGLINAGGGNVGVFAGGSIMDSGASENDITADSVELGAVGGIGLPIDHIDITVSTLAAVSGPGGIYIVEADSVTVGTVADVQTFQVQPDGASLLAPDPSIAGLSAFGGDGNIVMQTLAGILTVNQPVSAAGLGNILLRSQTASTRDKDLILNAMVSSEMGNISLVADRHLVQTGLGHVGVGGMGSIEARALTGSISMNDNASATSAGGGIRYHSTIDVNLGTINAPGGKVSVIAGQNISDNNGALVNVTAGALRLEADSNKDETGQIGGSEIDSGDPDANVNAIDTDVDVLAAISADGIYVLESTALIIDFTGVVSVEQVASDGMSSPQTDATLSDLETTDAGSIKVVTATGGLTVNEGDSDDTGVSAANAGDILLESRGMGSDIVFNADLKSGSGHITLSSGDDIDGNADVFASVGTVFLLALNGSMDNAPDDGVNLVSGSMISGGASVRISSGNDSDIWLSQVLTSGSADVWAGRNIFDNNGTANNVTASILRLQADTGLIGDSDPMNGDVTANARAIDTSVDVLAASSSDGMYVLELDSIVIDATGELSIEKVNFNSTRSALVTPSLSDLRTTGFGDVKLVALAGSITVNDGDQDNFGVRSNDVRLEARGTGSDVVINAEVRSVDGYLTLLADNDVDVNGDIRIDSIFAVYIDIWAGNNVTDGFPKDGVNLADGAAVEGGAVRIVAANESDIWVSSISAGFSVSLEAERDILDNNGAARNVSASLLQLEADSNKDESGRIGTADFSNGDTQSNVNAIDVNVGDLAAVAAGGIYILEENTVHIVDMIDLFSATADFNAFDATFSQLSSLSGLTTTHNGSIKLVAMLGEIKVLAKVDASGVGDILLEARQHDIEVSADLLGGSGHISVIAEENIGLFSNVLTTDGTVFIWAKNATVGGLSFEGILQFSGTVIDSGDGNIRLLAGNESDVIFSQVSAGSGSVSIVAERDILDRNGAAINVTAATLRLEADSNGDSAGQIGASDPNNGAPDENVNAIDTDVTTLAAKSATGLYIEEESAVIVDQTGGISVERVNFNSTTTTLTDASLSDLESVAGSSSVATVKLVALGGSITINDGDGDGMGVIAGSAVLLDARGAASDVVFNADLLAGYFGYLTVIADNDVDGNADILFGESMGVKFGFAFIWAGNMTVDGAPADGVNLASGTVIDTGDVRIVAGNESDVWLNQILSPFAVSIEAERDILDNNGAANNVTGTNLRLEADSDGDQAGQIGSADAGNGAPGMNVNAIDTEVQTLAAVSADGIYIEEDSGVAVGSTGQLAFPRAPFNRSPVESVMTSVIVPSLSDLETTDAGSIKVVSLAGGITIHQGDTDDMGVSAASSGNILLEARGTGSDIVFNADIQSGSGHITVWAADDIDGNADNATLNGTVYLQADNNSIGTAPNDGVNLAGGAQLNSGDGNVRIVATNESDIFLNDIQSGAGAVSLLAERDIRDNNGSATNVTAAVLRLQADSNGDQAGQIGGGDAANVQPDENVNALDTMVDIVAAKSADGIYIQERGELVMDILGNFVELAGELSVDLTGDISVAQVNFNSTTSPRTDLSLSDLETTDQGSIKIRSTRITIGEGDMDDTGVSAGGSGDVLLFGQDALTADGLISYGADIRSGSGHITLSVHGYIFGDADVNTTDGTVLIENRSGVYGYIYLADGSVINSGNGNVQITTNAAPHEIYLNQVVAGSGSVSLKAGPGLIFDNNGDDNNVTASVLRVETDFIGGFQFTLLETDVETLAAIANTSLWVLEADDVTVDSTGDISVQRVNFNSTSTTETDLSLSDLEGNDIVLATLDGSIVINQGDLDDTGVSANGYANFYAEGAGSDVIVNADIKVGDSFFSDSLWVSLYADNDVDVNADIYTTGELVIRAGNNQLDGAPVDGVNLADGTELQNEREYIWIIANNESDIWLNHVRGGGVVSVEAERDIWDNNGAAINVTTPSLKLVADADGDQSGQIGGAPSVNEVPMTNLNAIDTAVDVLAAMSADGIFILELDAVLVDAFSYESMFTNFYLEDLETTADGPIELVSLAGTVTINKGNDADDTGVSAGSGGHVYIEALGDSSDLIYNADIKSSGGRIDLSAENDVDGNADISSANGEVTIEAGSATVDGVPVDGVNLADGTLVDSGNGDVEIVAGNLSDVWLNLIRAGVGTVTVTAERDIRDNNDFDVNVEAETVNLVIDSPDGVAGQVGATGLGHIDTAVTHLNTDSSSANGDQWIYELDGLASLDINAGDGSVALISGGTVNDSDGDPDIQATTVWASIVGDFGAMGDGNSIDTAVMNLNVATSFTIPGGNQWIDEADGLSTLNLDAGDGYIQLHAGAAIEDNEPSVDIIADGVDVFALTGIGTMAPISTFVKTISLEAANGDIDVDNLRDDPVTATLLKTGVGSIFLSQSGVGSLTVDLAETGDGSIHLDSSQDLSALDVRASGGGSDVTLVTRIGGVFVDRVRATDLIDVLSASNLEELGSDADADLIASRLVLNAESGIGAMGALETMADFLIAYTDTGGIDLLNLGGLIVNGATVAGFGRHLDRDDKSDDHRWRCSRAGRCPARREGDQRRSSVGR